MISKHALFIIVVLIILSFRRYYVAIEEAAKKSIHISLQITLTLDKNAEASGFAGFFQWFFLAVIEAFLINFSKNYATCGIHRQLIQTKHVRVFVILLFNFKNKFVIKCSAIYLWLDVTFCTWDSLKDGEYSDVC